LSFTFSGNGSTYGHLVVNKLHDLSKNKEIPPIPFAAVNDTDLSGTSFIIKLNTIDPKAAVNAAVHDLREDTMSLERQFLRQLPKWVARRERERSRTTAVHGQPHTSFHF